MALDASNSSSLEHLALKGLNSHEKLYVAYVLRFFSENPKTRLLTFFRAVAHVLSEHGAVCRCELTVTASTVVV